jgi:Mn-dependent DtxR family transcriptional regulator
MYLETIYLLEQEHGHAHGVEIAKKLSVSKASVTKAVKNLKANGYISHESYGSITLTTEGKELSESIYLKHQMITEFLKHSLGVSENVASENACKMEHILTDELSEAISAYNVNNGIDFEN